MTRNTLWGTNELNPWSITFQYFSLCNIASFANDTTPIPARKKLTKKILTWFTKNVGIRK